MSIRKTLFAAAAAMTLAAPASALQIVSGDFKMIIDNYDSGTLYGPAVGNVCMTVATCDAAAGIPAPGSVGSVNTSADTMGIFSVASITRISDNSVWFARGPDGYLTGVFGNLMDYRVDTGAIGPNTFTSALAMGGTFSLFQNAADYDSTVGPGVSAGVDLNNAMYTSISDTGVLVLSGVFATGIIAGDLTTTYATSYNVASIKGEGGGYLDVTGGAWATNFDTNGVTDLNGNQRDMLASFTYFPDPQATANGWTVISSGQIVGNAVPEPSSILLSGLALLGAGFAARRRRIS